SSAPRCASAASTRPYRAAPSSFLRPSPSSFLRPSPALLLPAPSTFLSVRADLRRLHGVLLHCDLCRRSAQLLLLLTFVSLRNIDLHFRRPLSRLLLLSRLVLSLCLSFDVCPRPLPVATFVPNLAKIQVSSSVFCSCCCLEPCKRGPQASSTIFFVAAVGLF
ncbi:unnamed protein product, partial [Pylaiella littoralis]